ncbi:unnamed protein product [Candida verbasci]|uniref:Uncharacterized protein n=1 Tax=Candida verbasci TaxID=1227364 RepID=A0A9W4TZZ4_9ASCO|nr:unnamed protein product [Candida verbasci]
MFVTLLKSCISKPQPIRSCLLQRIKTIEPNTILSFKFTPILLQQISFKSTKATKATSPKLSDVQLDNSVNSHLQYSILKRKEFDLREEEKAKEKQRTFKQNFKTISRIIKLGKPDWKLFLLAIGFIFLAVLYPMVGVRLVGAILDSFNSGNKDDDGNLLVWGFTFKTLISFMVPFMLVSAVCFWSRNWMLKLLGERLVARLRNKIMKSLLRHDSKFYDNDKNKVGDLISRLSSDAFIVSRSITSTLPDGLKQLLFGVLSCFMMYCINPILFGTFLLISPPITIGSVFYGEKIRKLSTNLQNATANLTKVSEETLNSMKVVKSFTAEKNELNKYSQKLRDVVNIAKKEAFAQSNYNVSIYTLYHSGYLACISIGTYFMLNGIMTAGDVISFTFFAEWFNGALYVLTVSYLELMKGAGAAVKLFDLIDYKPTVDPIYGEKIEPSTLNNSVEFKDVTFAYPTRKKELIFNECSFKIQGGTSTCIVAPSGAGKSTVASLLLRNYNIQSGEILIGDKNIKNIQVKELRKKIIGIVQQEPILLSGTILENIIYGLTKKEITKLSMEDIYQVCKQANCHEFIMTFHDQYNTIIGNKGASLSGGQKQRIAIARALIKKPKILILDEATSALDSKSENLINETLKSLTTQGRITIISIAHRLSTISKSEYIIVLGKNGKIIESGKFIELFSDSNSELSKLLDDKSNNTEKDKVEENEKEMEDKEALKIENLQNLKNEINKLSTDAKSELIEQIKIENEIEIENKSHKL